jgi:thiol-disulfide isomerase/thioredoxin
MKRLLLITLIVPIMALAQNDAGINFQHNATWNQILAKAKAENKLVFVDAYTTWCGPCKVMAAKIFPQKEVGEYYNANFINAKIDMEAGEGVDLAKKYEVMAYPTYLYVDSDGKLVHRALGSKSAEKFIEDGQNAVDPEKRYVTLKEKYEAGNRDPKLLYNLTKAASALMDNIAPLVAEEYYKTQTDLFTKETLGLMLDLTQNPMGDRFNFLVQNEAKVAQVLGADVSQRIDNIVANFAQSRTYNRETGEFDLVEMERILKEYRPGIANKLIQEIKLAMMLQKKDFAGYEKAALAYYGSNKDASAQDLNQAAWAFFEHVTTKSSLEKALAWALQSVAKEDQYYNNDTIANLYHKLGNKKKAKEYAQKAIALGKANGEDVSDTQKLLNSLK